MFEFELKILIFLLCRYTELRKEEDASVHLGQIVKPDLSKPMMRLGVGDEYGRLKTETWQTHPIAKDAQELAPR